ncbi:hypothetical protein H8E88_26925 [candidate division KSB1 bacterium]|nr:hypothetical protein [candidate division KSB1 bacterium]MBL7092815.1 hypothetical protein [candidate division KSB1 bacterium]
MKNIFKIKTRTAFISYLILDLICVGMGMGVPIFCILFGFLVGWYNARTMPSSSKTLSQTMKKFLLYATTTSAFTFAVMTILWGRWAAILFNSNTDYTNLGIPMILFDPKASFIGWLVLMIFISPFLQLLTTLFASIVTMVRQAKYDSKLPMDDEN